MNGEYYRGGFKSSSDISVYLGVEIREFSKLWFSEVRQYNARFFFPCGQSAEMWWYFWCQILTYFFENDNNFLSILYESLCSILSYLESLPQCIAYILAKCPRRVRLVLICILPIGSIFAVAWMRVVSHAFFLAS